MVTFHCALIKWQPANPTYLLTEIPVSVLSTCCTAFWFCCLQRALWSDLFTGRLKTEIPDALVWIGNVHCFCHSLFVVQFVPSVLWRCWLGDRKGIRPVKNWVVGRWRGYLSAAMGRLAYGPADATATHCLLLQLNPDWFTFLVPAYLGSTRKGPLNVCVCVCLLFMLP